MSDALHAEHSAGRISNGEQEALYRTPGLTAEHIDRYVSALLREVLVGDDSHFLDAVHIAFLESGIHPLATLRCERVHFETLIERVNHFAERLRTRLETDRELHRTVSTAVAAVLNELTIVAPEVHPTTAELVELVHCCAPGTTTHIRNYDAYAARIAHLATCALCARRVDSVQV